MPVPKEKALSGGGKTMGKQPPKAKDPVSPAALALSNLKEKQTKLCLVDQHLAVRFRAMCTEADKQHRDLDTFANKVHEMFKHRLLDVMERRKMAVTLIRQKLETLEHELEAMTKEAKAKNKAVDQAQLTALVSQMERCFGDDEQRVAGALAFKEPTFYQELMATKVKGIVVIKSTLSAVQMKLTARTRASGEVRDSLWMELSISEEDAALTPFCQMHLHDLQLTVDQGDQESITKNIQLNELFSRDEVEVSARAIKFKIVLEDFSGDKFVHVDYLGTPVNGSPYVMSLRMNESFCQNQIPAALQDIFSAHKEGGEEKEKEASASKDSNQAASEEKESEGEKIGFITLDTNRPLVDKSVLANNNGDDLDESERHAAGLSETVRYTDNRAAAKKHAEPPEAAVPSWVAPRAPVPAPASPMPSSKKLIAIGPNSPMLASMRDQPSQQPLNTNEPFDPSTASTSATNMAEKLAQLGAMPIFRDTQVDSGILASEPGVDVNSMQKNLSGDDNGNNNNQNMSLMPVDEPTMYTKNVSFSNHSIIHGDGGTRRHPTFMDLSVAQLLEDDEHRDCRRANCNQCEVETVLQPNNARDSRIGLSSETLQSELSANLGNADTLSNMTMYGLGKAGNTSVKKLSTSCDDCMHGLCINLDHPNANTNPLNRTDVTLSGWENTPRPEPSYDLKDANIFFGYMETLELEESCAPMGIARHPKEENDITYVTDVNSNKVYKFTGKRRELFAPYVNFRAPRYIICFVQNRSIRVGVLDNNALYIFLADGRKCKAVLKGQVLKYRGLAFQEDTKRLLTTETTGKEVKILAIDALGKGHIVTTHNIRIEPEIRNPESLLVRYITYSRGYAYTTAMGTGQLFKTNFNNGETTVLRKSPQDLSEGQFNAATGLAVDPAGNILVGSKTSNMLSIVDGETGFRLKKIALSKCGHICDFVLQDRFLFVVDLKDKCVKKLMVVEAAEN